MLLLFLLTSCCIQSLKVLVHMGLGTNSHIKPLLEMGAILRTRNHTVLYAAFESGEKYNKPYQLPFVSLGDSKSVVWGDRDKMKQKYGKREEIDPAKGLPTALLGFAPGAYDATYSALESVLDIERPDVIVCDFLSAGCRDVAQMKGIPLITGFQTTDMFSITNAPFLTTNMAYGSVTTDSLGFFQRFQNKLLVPITEAFRHRTIRREMNKVRSKHGVPPSDFTFGDYSVSLGLSSSFIGFEAAIPFPPYIKMIGPIKSDSHDPLTPDLASFLDSHPRTLYIAFGSAVILADFDVENIVVGSLHALKSGHIDGILWGLGRTIQEDFPKKFKSNETTVTNDQLFKNQHPHVLLLPWAPQTAILEHKHTRLFISHGGLESSFEAILSGTPILCMPFLGDQPRNARKLEDAGIGKYINRVKATPESLNKDITFMLDDVTGSIAANVQRMRIIATAGSQRKASGADAIEEYAYTAQICRPISSPKFGEIPCELKHLAPASRNMSFIEANLIDVYTFAILLAFWLSLAAMYTLWWLIRRVFTPTPGSTKKKN